MGRPRSATGRHRGVRRCGPLGRDPPSRVDGRDQQAGSVPSVRHPLADAQEDPDPRGAARIPPGRPASAADDRAGPADHPTDLGRRHQSPEEAAAHGPPDLAASEGRARLHRRDREKRRGLSRSKSSPGTSFFTYHMASRNAIKLERIARSHRLRLMSLWPRCRITNKHFRVPEFCRRG